MPCVIICSHAHILVPPVNFVAEQRRGHYIGLTSQWSRRNVWQFSFFTGDFTALSWHSGTFLIIRVGKLLACWTHLMVRPSLAPSSPFLSCSYVSLSSPYYYIASLAISSF